MPRLSRWFIRAALVYLAAGFTLGGLILTAKAGAADSRIWLWLPCHVDLLLAGWMVQLAMGVAYWILPRRRSVGRGRAGLAWAAFGLLNIGLAIAVGAAGMQYWRPEQPGLRFGLPIGVLAQTAALGLFVLHAWPRILPPITAAELASRRPRAAG